MDSVLDEYLIFFFFASTNNHPQKDEEGAGLSPEELWDCP